MINIGGDRNDASYRYKMPRLITKIEGRGNGIKTVIVNMVDVAKHLKCEPQYTTKFFGLELGAQSKFEKKNERAVVNGAFDAPVMQQILNKFLRIYILCPSCQLPEIVMRVKASVTATCAACGWTGPLGANDRLAGYIVKHPPAKQKKGKKSADADSKGKRRKGGRKSKVDPSDAPAPVVEAVPAKPVEVVWYTDVSKEAEAKRREEEFQTMGSVHVRGQKVDVTKTQKKTAIQSPVEILRDMIAREESVSALTAEVRRLSLARELDEIKTVRLVFEALFDFEEPRKMAENIVKHAEFLKHYTKTPRNASDFIGVFEEIVGVTEPNLLPRAPIFLQGFYETEVLDEDAIMAWAESDAEFPTVVDSVIADQIREVSKPFIEWLQNAEESEEEDEDDEEDDADEEGGGGEEED